MMTFLRDWLILASVVCFVVLPLLVLATAPARARKRHQLALGAIAEENIRLAAALLDAEGRLADLEFAAVRPVLDVIFGDTSPLAQMEWEQHTAEGLALAHAESLRPVAPVIPIQRSGVEW